MEQVAYSNMVADGINFIWIGLGLGVFLIIVLAVLASGMNINWEFFKK